MVRRFCIVGLAMVLLTAVSVAQNFDVMAWGANAAGQLGDASNTERWTPVNVQGISGVQMVAGGGSHSLALLSNGTVVAWGSNSNGQLGDGTNIDRNTPVPVTGLTNVIAVSAGEAHSLALKLDGSVWAWGRNVDGVLGDGTTTDRWAPTKVISLGGVIEIAAGDNHNVVVMQNGQVFAWGSNNFGQLGDGTTTPHHAPQQVDGLINMVDGAAGAGFTIALRDDGSVFTWGHNNKGQLGDGSTQDNGHPQIVVGLTQVIEISGGKEHCLTLRYDTTVWGWGGNDLGQLGDGSTTNRAFPVRAQGLIGATRIADMGQANHSVARKSDGTVWAWGSNSNGQLGNGSNVGSNLPQQVPGLTDVQEVGGDRSHSLAMRGPGKPVGVLIPQTPVAGGVKTVGAIVLNDYSDPQRLVRMTDDSPYVLMSTYCIVLAYRRTGTFTIWTYGVANTTLTTISASFDGVTQAVVLTLVPATPDLLWLSPTSVVGGNPSMGNIRLNGMAPVGGVTVTLTTSNPAAANHAASVVVSYGATTKQFPVSTFGVDTVQNVTITATSGAISRSAIINVRPAALQSLTLDPTSVVGGTSVTATVAMSGKTGPSGRTINLSSDQPKIIVPATMVVPKQKSSWPFTVTTQSVSTVTTGTITASQAGVTKTVNLTLTP